MLSIIPKTSIALALVIAGLPSAHATTVLVDEIASITGLGSASYSFTIPVTGTYKASLYDVGRLIPNSGTPFSALAALITPSAQLVIADPGPGLASVAFVASTGSIYSATVTGFEPNGTLTGKFAFNVQSVPLPIPVVLLGTALVSVTTIGRRARR